MPQNKTYKNYLLHKHTNKFKFHIINEDEVSNIIEKLKPTSSLGFDGILLNLIKNTKTLLIEPLIVIIHKIITNWIFPEIYFSIDDDEQLFTKTHFILTINIKDVWKSHI